MQTIKYIVVDALWQAYETHERLGSGGEAIVQTNQFGDTALLADIKCEEAVLEVLRQSDLPIKVISEEHGVTETKENAKYLGILDGIDGSAVYKKALGRGRYGTMFAIFDAIILPITTIWYAV